MPLYSFGIATLPSSPMELSIVVPVYQDAEAIRPFVEEIAKVLTPMACSFEVLFCVDPSPDNTIAVIQQLIDVTPWLGMITLSRRFGQGAATMAGLRQSRGQYVVVMDVDLQDPPDCIPLLYRRCQQGFDVVYAQRQSRDGETWLKRMVAALGYRLINRLSDCPVPRDTGDFRIIRRHVVDQIVRLDDPDPFLRGINAYIGFKQTAIIFARPARQSGRSHYCRWLGSIKIGLQGLFGYSRQPLAYLYWPALITLPLCGLTAVMALVRWCSGITPQSSSIVIWWVVFFGGLQSLAIAIIGEYVGRLWMAHPSKPSYIIDSLQRPSPQQHSAAAKTIVTSTAE